MDLLDSGSALGQAVTQAEEREIGLVKEGEQPYRPWDPSLDQVRVVSTKDFPGALQKAREIHASVRAECAYLNTRLRSIARALEMTDTFHGVPRGRGLSERMLVDTYLTIQSGGKPRRAYYQTEQKLDLSMAVAVVVDESGSMGMPYGKSTRGSMGDGFSGCTACGDLQVKVRNTGTWQTGIARCGSCGYQERVQLRRKKDDASRMLLAIADPCERLGFAVQCSGFRSGSEVQVNPIPQGERHLYHRYDGKIHDVFKGFGEKLRSVLHRFALVQANGSTPLADGIQFGLDSLSCRDEAHRILIVLTDGEPTEGHRVIPWQLRVAKEAGIHVIGVGIGGEAAGVKTRFDDWIWDADSSAIPKLLVQKLNDLLDLRATKRGRRIKKPKTV